MNRTDEQLLSRHLDGDLNAEELEYVEYLLKTDTSVLDHFEQLDQVRVSVGELPREPIPEDMVPRVRRLIDARKEIPLSRKTAEILGRWAVAALVLVVSGVWVSVYWNHRPAKNKAAVETARNEAKPAQEKSDNLSKSKGRHRIEPDNNIENSGLLPTGNPEIVAAIDQMPNVNLRSTNQSRSQLPSPAPKPAVTIPEIKNEPLPVAFQALFTAAERIDRRHSIRIHVATANTRVMDKIIGLLEKYRIGDVPLARFQENDGQGEQPSVDFLAFVPTNKVDDLNVEISAGFQGQIERDLPKEIDWRSIDRQKIKFVPQTEILKALAGSENGLNAEVDREKTDALKFTFGPNRRGGVGDAIAEPLEKLQSDRPSATVDQVIIQLRSDIHPQ